MLRVVETAACTQTSHWGHKPGAITYFCAVAVVVLMQRVYQFHMESASAVVTEEHILGYFDKAATEAAAAKDRLMDQARQSEAARAWHEQQRVVRQQSSAAHKTDSSSSSEEETAADGDPAGSEDVEIEQMGHFDPGWKPTETAAAATAAAEPEPDKWSKYAPPMLELLDYLPDTISMVDSYWPYFRQVYSGGEPCGAEGKGRPRSVELRVACSPHKTMQLLIREPDFCRYVMVLYHPALCQLPRYNPVHKATLGQAAAAAVKQGEVSGGAAAGGVGVTQKDSKGQDKKTKSVTAS